MGVVDTFGYRFSTGGRVGVEGGEGDSDGDNVGAKVTVLVILGGDSCTGIVGE